MKNIKELNLEELGEVLENMGYPRFHSRQIFSWLYKKGVNDFDGMSDLSLSLREKLKEKFVLNSLRLVEKVRSKDRTEKFLFALNNGDVVEAALIPASSRVTACVSTQVGCKYACCFCASGKLGFKNNLTLPQILDQTLYIKNASVGKKLTHVVFMGIGEPLDNYDNFIKAARIINSKAAFNIGARRITVSTCGIIPGIKRLSEEGLQIELSVSLHSGDDKMRSLLMPVNKIYPLKELMAACREYIKKTNRQITFEYTLIKGFNSDVKSALQLSKLLKGMNAKVNIIPSNTAVEGWGSPEKKDVVLFRDCLIREGTHVTVRRTRGADIDAACGQLRLRHEKKENAV